MNSSRAAILKSVDIEPAYGWHVDLNQLYGARILKRISNPYFALPSDRVGR